MGEERTIAIRIIFIEGTCILGKGIFYMGVWGGYLWVTEYSIHNMLEYEFHILGKGGWVGGWGGGQASSKVPDRGIKSILA